MCFHFLKTHISKDRFCYTIKKENSMSELQMSHRFGLVARMVLKPSMALTAVHHSCEEPLPQLHRESILQEGE